MKKVLLASLALSLAACGDKAKSIPANQLVSTDFESLDGWLGDTPPSLTREKAHSGRYSLKVDPTTEYSMGYNMLLGKLSPSKLRKIKLHAWVYLPKGSSEVVLVTQITDPASTEKPLMWDGFKLADKAKANNEWVNVEKEITLPENINYTNKLSVYLWRANGSNTAFVDDLTIDKVE